MTKNVSPSVKETAFSCPHCGAYTTQFWYKLYVVSLPQEDPIPPIPSEVDKALFTQKSGIPEKEREIMLAWFEKMLAGLVFTEHREASIYCKNEVYNLYLTRCYNCKKNCCVGPRPTAFPCTKNRCLSKCRSPSRGDKRL